MGWADSPKQPDDMYSRHRRLSDSRAVSVTYAVEVIQNGKVTNVPNSYTFKKGDSVRFHVQSNTDGYMYILASGAGSGQYDVLYPSESASQKSLRKGRDYHLPDTGVKVKDSKTIQSVRLVFSKRKLEIDSSRALGTHQSPLIAVTARGSISQEKPPESFGSKDAFTITLTNSAKPLSFDLEFGKRP